MVMRYVIIFLWIIGNAWRSMKDNTENGKGDH